MKTRLKKNDEVMVVAGKDKGKTGKVLDFVKAKNGLKVKVEQVNVVKKHVKPNQVNQEGGIFESEAAIDISNVMLIDKKSKKPTRVGVTIDKDGNKKRVSKKSKEVID